MRRNIGVTSPWEVQVGYSRAALEEAGASLADVVRTRLYVTDIAHWEAVGQVHAEVFGQIRPAATLGLVAALINPHHLIEIEADATVENVVEHG